MRNEELADLIIERLNAIATSDPSAIGALMVTRVPCSTKLAHHPTVQVQDQDGAFWVGVLGLLNGIVGVIEDGPKEGWGFIAAILDDDGTLLRFERTEPTTVEAVVGAGDGGQPLDP